MSEQMKSKIDEICKNYGSDSNRMMDIVRAVQSEFGCVSSQGLDIIAAAVGSHRVEVESVVSFYAFLSKEQKGKVVIRLCEDIIDQQQGSDEVGKILAAELGIDFGQTSSDGKFTLEHAPCIGMCDQAPAMMVNDVVVTNLTAASAKAAVAELKGGAAPEALVKTTGDGNNANPLVNAMVENKVLLAGEVLFADNNADAGLKNAVAGSPEDVIKAVKTSNLRGRGGAGFPTGMKWDFTRGAKGDKKYIICNADEGEPGTFKDRALLTEKADLLFEGMTIGGYAIGSDEGILYLRGEYAYMEKFLNDVLAKRRAAGTLGSNVCGKDGFNFDIRVQLGAGAYICGEESALISSCEGLRGDPKTRPPFPAQKGYLGTPTSVNNVETFMCAARVLDKGADWFKSFGTKNSAGTKALSICGDCEKPGIYEVPFGLSIKKMLEMVGAKDTAAVQVGGPSGKLIAPDMFNRIICFDDLGTGGSIMIFNSSRNILEIIDYFMDFFIEESCGYCTPCRAGNVLLKKALEKVMAGNGEASDIAYMQELGQTVIKASRCGLGQTSANPVLCGIENFRGEFDKLLKENPDGMQLDFSIKEALQAAVGVQGRESVHF